MKILRLPAYFTPEKTASAHLQLDRMEAFSKAKIEMAVYTPVPTRGIDKAERQKLKKEKYCEMYDGYVKIHRFSLMHEGHNAILRALRYILSNIIQYFYGSRESGVDVIYASSTPPTQGVLCGLVKKKLCKKYKKYVPIVYNLQDIFPDSLVNANMTHKGSLLWKIGRKVEDYTYRHADKIIVISEGFKRNIMEKGVPEDKIVIIPNWIDTDSVYPIDRKDNVLFDRYHLDRNKFYVCYSGNIGLSQNLSLLLETAKEIKDELPDVRFVLIGEGAAKEDLEKAIRDEGIDNILLLPFQPYEEIAHVFSLGDADLIISKPGIGGSSVPSKTWSIMAAARPIIASFDADSELCSLVRQTGCGCTAAAGSREELIAAIKSLYSDRADNVHKGMRGRSYVTENLNKQKCTGMYVDTILHCAGDKR